jgi:hypothetical protein
MLVPPPQVIQQLTGDAGNELRVFNTETWRRVTSIHLNSPVWSAVAAPGGKTLCAPSPATHSIDVIDAASRHEFRPMRISGVPAFVQIAP